MTEFGTPAPRLSALPWSLYQSEDRSAMRAAAERDGFNLGMLKDDLRKQRYAYNVSLLPQGVGLSRASEIIRALLNDFIGTGYGRDAIVPVFDFTCALLDESVDGQEMYLEFHALLDKDHDTEPPRSRRADNSDQQDRLLPSLGYIPGWSVAEHRSVLSQVSPESGQPHVNIPRSRIQPIALRNENKRRWKRTIRKLRRVDAAKLFGTDRLSWAGYSFSEQVAVQKFAVAATTAPIGWDGRGSFTDSVTSPYLTFRRLRFLRFWVDAVDDSVAFLNQYTRSEALYGEEAFTFSLAGLPSPHGLTEAMSAVRSGSLTVEAAQDKFFFPKLAARRSESSDSK